MEHEIPVGGFEIYAKLDKAIKANSHLNEEEKLLNASVDDLISTLEEWLVQIKDEKFNEARNLNEQINLSKNQINSDVERLKQKIDDLRENLFKEIKTNKADSDQILNAIKIDEDYRLLEVIKSKWRLQKRSTNKQEIIKFKTFITNKVFDVQYYSNEIYKIRRNLHNITYTSNLEESNLLNNEKLFGSLKNETDIIKGIYSVGMEAREDARLFYESNLMSQKALKNLKDINLCLYASEYNIYFPMAIPNLLSYLGVYLSNGIDEQFQCEALIALHKIFQYKVQKDVSYLLLLNNFIKISNLNVTILAIQTIKQLIKVFDCNNNIEFMNYEITTKRETKLENEILSNTMDAFIDAVERHKSIDIIYVVIDAVLSRCRSFSFKKKFNKLLYKIRPFLNDSSNPKILDIRLKIFECIFRQWDYSKTKSDSGIIK